MPKSHLIMNYKNLLIFSIIVVTVIGILLSYVAYRLPIDHNTMIHEHWRVIECIPVEPDEYKSELGLHNDTHIFNERICKWIEL